MIWGKDTPALVTGGSSGLGAAVAKMLIAAGVPTGILDLNAESGAAFAGETGVAFARCDVADPSSVSEALTQLRNINGMERICVNCAGIAPAARTVSRDAPHDPALFQKVISVNLIGTFNVASQSAAGMSRQAPVNADGERGVIINTASIAAFEGQIGQVAYAASKAAVAGMTLPMARDLAKAGIRVVAIAPGIFQTQMVSGFSEDVQEALAKSAEFPRRLGRPDEYASLVRHVIDNTMINGEVIRLDAATRMATK
ncbi:MAG: SDR family NAD(P)-dependent oxidoreductase [Mesorhizobium sp.]|uniref:SDR family NAD(P)-dependent oxidoreductase n=1 Tax=Mesorhizobium sp. TaxID=1871066 RepID=UPI001AD546D9|nr:SDR family NAD(P)-dependent oxidoreductase [Mesorhizobium sp.]MBN9221250.1 SDR family NAD(P)-dependent oxidoreductase [Mesorhizobium sp.]